MYISAQPRNSVIGYGQRKIADAPRQLYSDWAGLVVSNDAIFFSLRVNFNGSAAGVNFIGLVIVARHWIIKVIDFLSDI